MNNLESKQDYLECILMLSEEKEIVRAIDISKKMGFSKPSVSIALKKLKNAGYILVNDKTGGITLSKTGNDIALEIYERHKILTSALIMIGVSEKTAKEDACKIEHDISSETLDKIKSYISKCK